jgi:hypothetical protein
MTVALDGTAHVFSLPGHSHQNLLPGTLAHCYQQQGQGSCQGPRVGIDRETFVTFDLDRERRIPPPHGCQRRRQRHRQVKPARAVPQRGEQIHSGVQFVLAHLGPTLEIAQESAFLGQAVRQSIEQDGHSRVDGLQQVSDLVAEQPGDLLGGAFG